MKTVFTLFSMFALVTSLVAQTDGVGIGVADPQEKLDVAGAIRIGTTTNANAGTIRYTGTDFEGYVNGQWVSLTSNTSDIVFVEDWNNNSTYASGAVRDVTGYSGWMNVTNGDILKMQFTLSCRLTGGNNTDNLDFRVYIDGDSGCGDTASEWLFYTPAENTDDHDNFKPIGYLDVIAVTCTGRLRFKIQLQSGGDDDIGVRDRSLAVTRYK